MFFLNLLLILTLPIHASSPKKWEFHRNQFGNIGFKEKTTISIRFPGGEKCTCYDTEKKEIYDRKSGKYSRKLEAAIMYKFIILFQDNGYEQTTNAYHFIENGSGLPIPDTRESKSALGKLD